MRTKSIVIRLLTVMLAIVIIAGNATVAFAANSETSIALGDSLEGTIALENIIENGKAAEDAVVGDSGTASVETSGRLKTDNPVSYDQTTVTTTDRTASAVISDISVTGGDPIYTDTAGNPIYPETGNSFKYYYSDIWDTDGKSAFTDGADLVSWVVPYFYSKDDPSDLHAQKDTFVCQRIVNCDNGTPDDYSDDYCVSGLYCVDLSTTAVPEIKYRLVNLEDAAAEGYYTQEEAEHLRAILKYGYSWGNLDGDLGESNLSRIKEMMKDAQQKGLVSDDIDFDSLTREQAATATNMAIWTYANRLEDDTGVIFNALKSRKPREWDTVPDGLYNYLITFSEEPGETKIINEDNFIDSLSMEIGSFAEGRNENSDSNLDNDVYSVSIKFSLARAINEIKDSMIAKINDSEGTLIKKVRLAGTPAEDEELAETVTENEKVFYLVHGMDLAENAENILTIKLEGTQFLEQGVYIFESDALTPEEAAAGYLKWLKSTPDMVGYVPLATKENVSGSVEEYNSYMEKYGTEEEAVKAIAEKMYTLNQNYIGTYCGNVDVDVSAKLSLKFSVDEAVITTERIWNDSFSRYFGIQQETIRTLDDQKESNDESISENDSSENAIPEEEHRSEIPGESTQMSDMENESVVIDEKAPLSDSASTDNIPSEGVPLSDIPKTGNSDGLLAAALLAAGLLLTLTALFNKKRNAL